MESVGSGWIAAEALGMAVYAARCHPGSGDERAALTIAVTHAGDSDSTGAICGNLLGTLHGDTALPIDLVFAVEGRGTILQLADDLAMEFASSGSLHGLPRPYSGWERRYPGG
jgi:ADP-ribosylglycohydrolase